MIIALVLSALFWFGVLLLCGLDWRIAAAIALVCFGVTLAAVSRIMEDENESR